VAAFIILDPARTEIRKFYVDAPNKTSFRANFPRCGEKAVMGCTHRPGPDSNCCRHDIDGKLVWEKTPVGGFAKVKGIGSFAEDAGQ